MKKRKSQELIRCGWCGHDPLYIKYHDTEWGVPVTDDWSLFEFLVLEGAQAGLSWITILRKRENYRLAFDNFDPVKVAGYNATKIDQLIDNLGIIRNRRKIEAAILNARAFLKVQVEFGSFAEYLWSFVDYRPIRNNWETLKDVPAQTVESQTLSRDLQKRGFKFVGPTICYSLMQAVGMVNDHLVGCFRHAEVSDLSHKNNIVLKEKGFL
ncbi:MAG: DNA-3-methyladenine glycosylase I [Bacteroidota bacterium]